MKTNIPPIQHVSDTAFWVAAHRATETERPDALFKDPYARLLSGEKGRELSSATDPRNRYTYWTLSIRTALIDRLILDYVQKGGRFVINLGAGLDTRPYRLKLPADLHWYELDFKSVIDYKTEKLSTVTPVCKLTRISVDLSEALQREQCLTQLNQQVQTALVLTEGVVPYLTEEQVRALALDLKKQSNFLYWIAEYYSPKLYPRFQADSFKKQMGSAHFRFFPPECLSFYKSTGWNQKDLYYLNIEGEKLGRRFPLPWWAEIFRLFANKSKLAEKLNLTGYVLLER